MRSQKVLSSRWLFGVLGFFCLMGNAYANADGNDLSVTLEKLIQRTVVNDDGSFIMTAETVMLINEERGIQAQAQRSLSYNRTLETLEVTEAYTQKPDGRKVLVKAADIKEQQEPASANAPMFMDTLVKVVVFPEVAVGDRLVLGYKKHRTTPLLPGQFEDISSAWFYPAKQFTLIYDLPEGKPLYADARGFKLVEEPASAGRKVYRWDYVQSDKARLERGAVSYLDYGQFLAVSTFSDFVEFGKAYDQRARASVTPEVAQLAKSLTAKLDTPRAKAIALNDWVRKNIRYVAVFVGAGSVVPHPVDAILANRYGDCKDHVALLEALLASVGLESSPALINLGNAYTLPKVPTLGVINHVITYILSLDLYLDSTVPAIAGGYLPVPDLDKPVVLTRLGKLARTPATQSGGLKNLITYTIDASGGADFVQLSSISGWAAELNRYVLKSMKASDRNQLIQRAFAAYGQSASGVLDTKELDGTGDEYSMAVTGRTQNLVNLPGPIGVPTISSFSGGIADNVFAFVSESVRNQGFTCISGKSEEEARFEFPASVQVLATPKPMSLKQGNFDYSSTYEQQGNVVVLKRSYAFTHPAAVCTPEDFETMKPSIDAMVNDLKGQIIVRTI
ncbi:putative cysteine proteases [Paucimonas lemoignei]|nr:putative cysteine proteases [Paucimonas lemoignei]